MTQYDGYRNSIQWNYADDKTCLLSIHGDKGKSHKVVFVLGVTQKSIPDECCMHKETELLYDSLLNVALTRSTRHLFIGFHHKKPSIYLSRVIETITDEACLAWKPETCHGVYADISRAIHFPEPVFVNIFREHALKIPTLNIMTITETSRRYERAEDLLGFRPKIETVVFGKRAHFNLPHDVYPVLGCMAELLLLQTISPKTFQTDLKIFSDPSKIVFTHDERLLCWARDYHLHQWIGTDTYQKNISVIKDTYASILRADQVLATHLDTMMKHHAYVIPKCFDDHHITQTILRLLNSPQTRDLKTWWNVSVFFYEIKNRHQKPSLYRYIDMDFSARQVQSFQVLLTNIKQLSARISDDIVFQPSHDMVAHINDAEVLRELGFIDHPELDENIYKHGYHYGIVGNSDIMDRKKMTLYEIKASHIDFSVEWLLQASLYGCLPFRHSINGRVKDIVVANVATGRLYMWECPKKFPRVLLKTILELQSFPSFLIENLLKMNHRRLKKHSISPPSSLS
jgi:hypothetical protein